jgi:hypothetical protein
MPAIRIRSPRTYPKKQAGAAQSVSGADQVAQEMHAQLSDEHAMTAKFGMFSAHGAREAQALIMQMMLERRVRYAITTLDTAGKVVIFCVDPEYGWNENQVDISAEFFRVEMSTYDMNRYGSQYFTTSLKAAEKRLTAIKKWLASIKALSITKKTDPRYGIRTQASIDSLTVVRLDLNAVAIHPAKKGR